MAEPRIFVNGQRQDTLSALDRGLAYGHGVFETMRLHGGAVPLWPLHLERVVSGGARLGIPVNYAVLEQEYGLVVKQLPLDGVLKLIVTAGTGGRGYHCAAGQEPCRIFTWFPAARADVTPVELQLCQYRLPRNPVLAGIKHLNRLDQVMAARELTPGQLGLLLDDRDHVIEGISHNVFAFIDGGWRTPLLNQAGVEGVMRRYVMEMLLPELGFSAGECEIPLDMLRQAKEIILTNALVGVVPVRGIAGLQQWSQRPETGRLQQSLWERLPCFAP